MSDQTDNLLNLVKPYGLSDDEGRVYLRLLTSGFSSALSLSRVLHMGRTKVYRLLDKLSDRQLVETRVDERGMQFGATHPQKFEQLVTAKAQEVATLQQSLPQLLSQLQGLVPKSAQHSKVLYYEGVEGLKQVSFNITRAKDMVRVYEMEHLSEFLPVEFAEDVRRELVKNHILAQDLTNQRSWPGYTDVAELVAHYAQSRYIDPAKLQINFEILIYNDVYATYTYHDDVIFCVEIYNDQLAAMQKQIFDFIWNQAAPMQFTDGRGAAVLASE